MMYIAIWSEFSSNHSASFTVVGNFATPQSADVAAAQVRTYLQEIYNWYNDPSNAEAVKKRKENAEEAYQYTPLEIAMKDHYQVGDYFIPVDWIEGGVEEAVHTFENHVFVENTQDTWSGYPPFPELLTKLGAVSVLVSDEYTPSIVVNIRCKTADPHIVEQIRQSIEAWQNYDLDVQTVELEAGTLNIRGFSAWKLYESVPAYIQCLQQQGCSGIQYEYIITGSDL
jgi:hypothetical protein